MESTRINKYLSQVGYCSRRQADKLIETQRVTINGKVPEVGTKVEEGDKVAVDGNIIATQQNKQHTYLLFNKPKNIVCTADQKREKNNIIDFINYPERIFYAGRLDKNSEGLMFMTNDGAIVNQMMRARNLHEKEYQVTVNRPITTEFIHKMQNGIPILDTITRKCKITQTDNQTFTIILTQGLNRQIRRMCEHLEYRVEKLVRTRIMNLELDLPSGKWRHLTKSELINLKQQLS